MARFPPIQLNQDCAAQFVVIEGLEQMERFVDASEVGQRLGELAGLGAHLECAHQGQGRGMAHMK